jgi:hypothetical protein
MLTEASISNEWRTQHLFVLVGGNPLPNVVVSKLLLADTGTLHLVHSSDTAEVANRIGTHFPRYSTHEIKDSADGVEIQGVVGRAVNECGGSSVGLNYTGGTKAMAVHAHQAITQALPKPVLTYLDAHNLALLRTDINPVERYPAQYAVTLSIEELFQLHGIGLDARHPVRRTSRHEALNQVLARAHTTVAGQVAFDTWCRQYLRYPKGKDARRCKQMLAEELGDDLAALVTDPDELYGRALFAVRGGACCGGELVDDLKDFPVRPIPYPTDSVLHEVGEAMREAFGIDGAAFDPAAVTDNLEVGLKNAKDLTHYLDGDWVEHLALAAFIAHKDTHHLHDWGASLQTTTQPYDFEFDAAAMQGYQLYAVSCTRSADKGLCKSKLFEAYVRAAQLGGDEAKVGLVCCHSSPAALQQQVQELWRAETKRFRVFGNEDIARLPERFGDWLSGC